MENRQWNSAQRTAICHQEGPLLVCAGPGSGKTSVIIAHVEYLIRSLTIPPDHILVVTFTKAAAQEMKERFFAVPGNKRLLMSREEPRFGTMHSVFFEILRKSAAGRSFRFISETDRRACLLKLTAPYRKDPDDVFLERLTGHISSFINSGQIKCPDPDDLGLSGDAFLHIFRSYQEFKRSHGLVDFDDILLRTFRLLSDDSQTAAYWQGKYRYILIDEFQDINELQYRCMRILAAPQNNLYVVGDEDQSIYGFRGSTPLITDRFLTDHPGCRTVFLTDNYRAPDLLLTPARMLISHNKNRKPKHITGRSGCRNASFHLWRCTDQQTECRMIAQTALAYQKHGISLNRQAVLLRSQRFLPDLLLLFQQCHIPVQIKGMNIAADDIRSHFITKDLAVYFQLAEDDEKNRMHLLQKIRFISLPHVSRYSLTDKDPLPISPRGLAELEALKKDLAFLSTLSAYPAAEYILKAMGYEQYLKNLQKRNHISSPGLANAWHDILTELKSILRRLKTRESFLEYLKKEREYPKETPETRDALQIRTMHSCKGLEFDVVYIPDLNKGLIPDSRAKGPAIEEERRLLYVAMTRARQHLHMFFLKELRGKPVFPSMFVYELMKNARQQMDLPDLPGNIEIISVNNR